MTHRSNLTIPREPNRREPAIHRVISHGPAILAGPVSLAKLWPTVHKNQLNSGANEAKTTRNTCYVMIVFGGNVCTSSG